MTRRSQLFFPALLLVTSLALPSAPAGGILGGGELRGAQLFVASFLIASSPDTPLALLGACANLAFLTSAAACLWSPSRSRIFRRRAAPLGAFCAAALAPLLGAAVLALPGYWVWLASLLGWAFACALDVDPAQGLFGPRSRSRPREAARVVGLATIPAAPAAAVTAIGCCLLAALAFRATRPLEAVVLSVTGPPPPPEREAQR